MDVDAKEEEKVKLNNPDEKQSLATEDEEDAVTVVTNAGAGGGAGSSTDEHENGDEHKHNHETREVALSVNTHRKPKLQPKSSREDPDESVYHAPEYHHIHYGTFYTSYFIWIILSVLSVIFLLAVYGDEKQDQLRAWIGFTWLFGCIIILLPIAYSFKYLQFTDYGDQLYISLGPLKLCCFMEENKIKYNNIKRVSRIEAGNCLRARKQIEYCFCSKTKLLAVGGWCDCQCCDACWRETRSVKYDHVEIQLKTKSNCLYDKIHVTTDDYQGLTEFLKSKNVAINPNSVKVNCC